MESGRAKIGYRGFKEAQLRLRRTEDIKKKQREESIDKLLNDTAIQNPLHAQRLNKMLAQQWSEGKGSYVIVSKLNDRERMKVHDLLKANGI